MKKTIIFFLLTGAITILSNCSSSEVTEYFPYGNFSYKSFNFVGEIVGEGSLYISKVDSNTVEGNWAIRDIKNCTVCGPQYGLGFLTGRIEGDSMYINLNPDNPENFVELVGELSNGAFLGDWRWFKTVVTSNRGTFKAVKM